MRARMIKHLMITAFGLAAFIWFGYLTNWKIAVALAMVVMAHNLEKHNEHHP